MDYGSRGTPRRFVILDPSALDVLPHLDNLRAMIRPFYFALGVGYVAVPSTALPVMLAFVISASIRVTTPLMELFAKTSEAIPFDDATTKQATCPRLL